ALRLQSARVPLREEGVRVLAPLPLVPEGPERPCVLDVIGLVEREGVRVAHPDQAQGAGEDEEQRRGEPGDQTVPLG
ncbi:hypothetical protein ABE10_00095, partial [Bacillus toyonensis]|nr:hypothetical protein [Bacillus toyonensis]